MLDCRTLVSLTAAAADAAIRRLHPYAEVARPTGDGDSCVCLCMLLLLLSSWLLKENMEEKLVCDGKSSGS